MVVKNHLPVWIRRWSVLSVGAQGAFRRCFLFLICLWVIFPHLACAQDKSESTPSYYLGDSSFTLDRALDKDKQILPLTSNETIDLTQAALLYPDPKNQATPALIASRYLRGERTRVDQKTFFSYARRGVPLWLVIPVHNRIGQTQWVVDFGNRLSGRTVQLSHLMVMDLVENKVFFNQDLSKTTAGFVSNSALKRYEQNISITLKPKTKHLILVYIKPNPNTPTIMRLALSSPAANRAFTPWLQEWPYLSAGFFMAGIVLSLALMASRPLLVSLALYLILLPLVSLMPLPLIDEGTTLVRASVLIEICAALFLGLGICAVARLTTIKLMWTTVQSLIMLIYSLFVVAVFSLSPVLLTTFSFQIGIILPVVVLMFILSYLQFQESDQSGLYTGIIGLITFLFFLAYALSIGQIIPPHQFTLNAVTASLFLTGPLLLFFLNRTNLFIEGADMAKRRRRSLNDETQLAKLRQAKETFDYNNLLKVIDHERRQLADARARESLRSEEMRKARDLADEANRAKSAFLAVISHEIRTPMTGVLGMVKLLLDTTLTKNQHEFVMTIKESGNAMMSLLNDILDFEKIESGKMHLEMLDFDLHRLISGVATLMNGHATTKGIELKIDLDPSVPQYVVGDMTRLRQILLNLVGNAVKFTQKGSVTIKISATVNDNESLNNRFYQIYFAITDTGIGISAEAQKNIFNPFSQADKTIARKFGGSGLGLAISKRLVEAMGSQINIKSREGQGTTFFFSLNMKEGDPLIADEVTNKTGKPSLKTPSAGQEIKLRILVVEDNAVTQKILQTIIEQSHHDVLVCASAEEAMPYLQMGERFDLILTDIQMHGMSGYEFARSIRLLEDPISRATLVYALTGNVDSSDISACLDAGMNGHLAKPIDPEAFDAVLELACSEKVKGSSSTSSALKAAPAPTTTTSALASTDPDLELLATLRDSLGDDQINPLLQSLYDKAEEIIETLTRAPDLNLSMIRERAHELKGMSGNFGMMPLSSLAKQIEKQAKDGVTDGLSDLIAKLEPTYRAGQDKIRHWMEQE